MPENWRRVVVKVGTSSLTDDAGRIHLPHLWALARGIQVLQEAKRCKVVLVSSGAGAVGRERLGLSLPLTLPDKQAAAAVGQALLMLDWARAFAPLTTAQLLLTASDIQNRQRYVNAKNTLEASLRLGVLPVVNENDSIATAEIKLGDNDTLSAWVAYLIDADALIILTDVHGLYEADPRSNPDARAIRDIDDVAEVMHLAGSAASHLGTGGMTTKLRAAHRASEAGIETLIIGGGGAGLEALARGEVWGTRIRAGAQQPARKAWIMQQSSRGRIVVDAGAARALSRGRSLLPSGVSAVSGSFEFGDAVTVMAGDEVLAQGLSNYSSLSLEKIKGLQTSDIVRVLGYKNFDEVIHRDNLVMNGARKRP